MRLVSRCKRFQHTSNTFALLLSGVIMVINLCGCSRLVFPPRRLAYHGRHQGSCFIAESVDHSVIQSRAHSRSRIQQFVIVVSGRTAKRTMRIMNDEFHGVCLAFIAAHLWLRGFWSKSVVLSNDGCEDFPEARFGSKHCRSLMSNSVRPINVCPLSFVKTFHVEAHTRRFCPVHTNGPTSSVSTLVKSFLVARHT